MVEMARVAVLTEPRTFDYREVAIPEIGPDEGVLRVEAAGLCGTDWEQYLGHLDNTPWAVRPIIPGHEILGWIDKVGPEAAKRWDVKEGDRVTVEASIPCGQCFQCQVGRPVLCKNGMGYGLRMGFNNAPHLWGGYATHMYLHPGATLHKAPSDVPTDIMSLFNPMSNAVRWAVERPETGIGDTIVIEPWRAEGFPIIKDLVVDRQAFDRIIAAGGYVSVNTGAAQDANSIPIPKDDADLAMDYATCIGCGACVAACPNASASLFTAAKIAQLSLLPQGAPERTMRVKNMVDQMAKEGFGDCSNHAECEAVCPKGISISAIATMRREYMKAMRG